MASRGWSAAKSQCQTTCRRCTAAQPTCRRTAAAAAQLPPPPHRVLEEVSLYLLPAPQLLVRSPQALDGGQPKLLLELLVAGPASGSRWGVGKSGNGGARGACKSTKRLEQAEGSAGQHGHRPLVHAAEGYCIKLSPCPAHLKPQAANSRCASLVYRYSQKACAASRTCAAQWCSVMDQHLGLLWSRGARWALRPAGHETTAVHSRQGRHNGSRAAGTRQMALQGAPLPWPRWLDLPRVAGR